MGIRSALNCSANNLAIGSHKVAPVVVIFVSSTHARMTVHWTDCLEELALGNFSKSVHCVISTHVYNQQSQTYESLMLNIYRYMKTF